MKYASILETIGRTPVVRLANLAPAPVGLADPWARPA